MTAPIERTRALVSRASHPGTPLEEARSCAVLACKAIAEHDMLGAAAKGASFADRQRLADLELQICRLSLKLIEITRERDEFKRELDAAARARSAKG